MGLQTEDVSLDRAGLTIRHPLDPLTAAEITAVTRILQDHFQWGPDLRVETIDIHEPAKDVVRHYSPETAPARVARFHVYRRGVMGVWDGLVDLGSAKVISAVFQRKGAADARHRGNPADRRDGQGRCSLSGSTAPPRPARGARIYVRRSLDRRRLQHPHRARAPGAQSASSGCACFRWTIFTPTRSRGCTR